MPMIFYPTQIKPLLTPIERQAAVDAAKVYPKGQAGWWTAEVDGKTLR